MPRPSAPLPDDLGRIFSAREARERGVTSRRLGGADLEWLFRGVYRRIGSDTGAVGEDPLHPAKAWRDGQLQRAQALAPFMPAGYFFCGRTAAVVWNLPVPPGSDDALEVACFSPGRGLRMEGVRGTRISPALASVARHDGLPVLDVASTWCTLAPRLAWRDGIALGDGAIRRPRIPGTRYLERPPHSTLEELGRLAAAPHRRDRARLLSMLPFLSPCSASAPESHLRLVLGEWGVPEPELDYDVFDDGGHLLGCSEIAFPEYLVAHEYEGDHHRTEPAQWNRDIQKYRAYGSAGWDVIRVTSQLLYVRTSELRAQTFDALRKHGWVPPG